jgi:DNA-binding IclR family transcriptional regulator
MPAKVRAPKQVLVLHKTLDVLEAIRQDGSDMGLSELSRLLAMPKATLYRILMTLETRGYLDRRENGSYQMSSKLFLLQQPASASQRLLQVAPPIMAVLAEECRETVNLGILDGGEVVVISTVESPQSIRMTSKVGNRRAVHTAALGKILLAHLQDSHIRRIAQVKGLPRLTANSITTQSALLDEIERVRKGGYAIDNQENEMEGRCVAVRIPGEFDLHAALSISTPVFRVDLRRLHSFLPALKRSCEAIRKGLAA